jgi:RNA polymerase sigma-70 factor (ECF subfamily)
MKPSLDWTRFLALLEPLHERARLTARRLAGSSVDGDDLFQETLLRAVERLPGLRDPARFAAWFYAVLLSVHRNRSRRGFWRRFVRLEPLLARGYDPPGADGIREAGEREAAARLSRALSRLPAVQREATVLHEIDGFSMQEIAMMQQVSLTAVKTRVARGRARLRHHYQRLEDATRAGRARPGDSPAGSAEEESHERAG